MKKFFIKTNLMKYPAIIGSSIINSLPALFSSAHLSKRVFVIIDKKINKLYNPEIRKVLTEWAEKIHYYQIAANENSKSFATVKNAYNRMMGNGFGRDTLLVAIGGGTVGDVSGFVASTYMRGVQIVHIPTTLLAVVDSSIGGKTGVNFSSAKNVIGTFYQPSLVLIDTNFLESLTDDEILSGTGEIIKYGYLSNSDFYSYIYSNLNLLLKLDYKILSKVISESIRFKAAVVTQDEFELTSLRKILNFGHTFAHAFESYFNFKLNHGKAVTAGIVAALFLSYRKKIINKTKLDYFLQLPLLVKDKNVISNYKSEKVIDLMNADKKIKKGKLNFVLIKDIGEMLVDVNVKRSDIIFALDKTGELLV
jgi:3-dehydroquinate synthase